jgi:hypothetical protein
VLRAFAAFAAFVIAVSAFQRSAGWRRRLSSGIRAVDQLLLPFIPAISTVAI